MAKGVKKNISIFLDGKQVENSAAAIKEAIAKATAEINKMQIGTDQYVNKAKQIRELRKVLSEHHDDLKKTAGFLDTIKEKLKDWSSVLQGAFFLKKGVDWATGMMQEYVDAFAKIDKVMANTQRATGMTREEVEALNEEFKKIDTTTPVEQLHNLAAIGAKLGYNTKAEILEFTEAANQIKVIFGEDFDIAGLTKLVKVFGEDDRLGIRGALMAIHTILFAKSIS